MKREKVKEQLSVKYKQSQQSHKLVEVFKKCVQDTCKDKQAMREQHGSHGNTLAGRRSLYVSKEDLTPLEKRRSWKTSSKMTTPSASSWTSFRTST
jgi:hypothetical protein